MISKIEINNIVPYTNGLTIDNLHKINYIYGANASGKTTLSHFLENPSEERYYGCSIQWKDGIQESIFVYNRYFREKNFGSSTIPGVFTLGQATKEQKEEIEHKISELENIKNQGVQFSATKEKLKNEQIDLINKFKDDIWKHVYKRYESVFSNAFDGLKNSKDKFFQKVLKEFNSNDIVELTSFDSLKKDAQTIFQKNPILLEFIQTIDVSSIVHIEQDEIWQKKVIGSADVEIGKLINRLNISDWVHEGKKLLRENSNVCPFCQKETIDENFKKQIELFFDDSFISDIETIKRLKEDYNRQSQIILDILGNIEIKEKQNKASKLNVELFSSFLKTLNSQFFGNKEIIENKLKEPSRMLELTSNDSLMQQILQMIQVANDAIQEHNSIVTHIVEKKQQLIQLIWKYLITDNKTLIETFVKKNKGYQNGMDNLDNKINNLRTKYRLLDAEIKELNKNITSIQPAVDEINKTLLTFGFTSFKIVPTKNDQNQYQIQRNGGEDATKTLSEGETTFITFLYFLQKIKGGDTPENVNNKRVVVIDDPISSLDSNVLFLVSSLIKEIIKDIRNNRGNIQQIIVLTHNVYFHKELSNIYLMKDDAGQKFNPYYWILRKNNNETRVIPYEQNCPIKSSYDLLWKELREMNNSSCVTVQNIMRRIIESYFKTWGGLNDDMILNEIKNPQEKEICRSLIYMINDGSHCVPDDLYVEQENELIEKYKNVFKLVFEKLGHIRHYEMMMSQTN